MESLREDRRSLYRGSDRVSRIHNRLGLIDSSEARRSRERRLDVLSRGLPILPARRVLLFQRTRYRLIDARSEGDFFSMTFYVTVRPSHDRFNQFHRDFLFILSQISNRVAARPRDKIDRRRALFGAKRRFSRSFLNESEERRKEVSK